MDPIFDLFLVVIEGEGEISHPPNLLPGNPILSKNELRFVMSFPSRHASRTHKWQPTRWETILSFILMEHLPPAGWSHLATKDDISVSGAVLRTEMAELRTELKTDMAGLRVEMERGFRSQTWKMVTAMIASQGVSVAIMAAMVNSLR